MDSVGPCRCSYNVSDRAFNVGAFIPNHMELIGHGILIPRKVHLLYKVLSSAVYLSWIKPFTELSYAVCIFFLFPSIKSAPC